MGWFSGFVVFITLWWIVFLMALPFGARSPHELGEESQPGHAPSAPVKPRLWLKASVVTAIAIVLWGIADYVITSEFVSFHTNIPL